LNDDQAFGRILHDETGRLAGQAKTAVTFRKIAGDQSERSHLAHQRAIDPPLLLTCLIAWRKLLAREAFRGRPKCPLLFAVRRGHAPNALADSLRYFTWRRKSGLRFSLKARTPSRDSSVW
jgi:hypothetical protein